MEHYGAEVNMAIVGSRPLLKILLEADGFSGNSRILMEFLDRES